MIHELVYAYRTLHEDSKTSNYNSNPNSSNPKTSTREDGLHLERVAWLYGLIEIVCLLDFLKWSPSPHIYRGEPPSPRPEIVHEPPWIDFILQWGAATLKTWGGGAHGQVGRPPSGPTDLLLLGLGCFWCLLVDSCGLGPCSAGFLLWWLFDPCVAMSY